MSPVKIAFCLIPLVVVFGCSKKIVFPDRLLSVEEVITLAKDEKILAPVIVSGCLYKESSVQITKIGGLYIAPCNKASEIENTIHLTLSTGGKISNYENYLGNEVHVAGTYFQSSLQADHQIIHFREISDAHISANPE